MDAFHTGIIKEPHPQVVHNYTILLHTTEFNQHNLLHLPQNVLNYTAVNELQ